MSSQILLVRHGSAGSRADWEGDDRLRPLDAAGHAQAAWLAQQLASRGAGRVLSSPYLRCMQTAKPVAELRGVPVEACPELAEDISASALRAFVAGLRDEPADAVLCTHGDVAERLLGDGAECAKGSLWILQWRDRDLVPVSYLPPLQRDIPAGGARHP